MGKSLPPLNAIRAFEAASRHLNLSRAADELGVTQGAISKQVIALEDYIGAQLFERESGGISLTQEGHNLRESIRPAFALLSDAFARYSRRPPRASVVRISTLASFAAHFLVPRLADLRAAHPEFELEFLTSMRVVDLAREEIDFAVRYGPGNWEGVNSEPLAPGRFIPVCAPDMLARAGGDLATLLKQNRRFQNSTFNEWRKWAEHERIDLETLTPAVMIEDFVVCAMAAINGQGLALLPELLTRHHIAKGELVRFAKSDVATEFTYHLVHTPNALRRPHVRDAMEWLKAQAAFQ